MQWTYRFAIRRPGSQRRTFDIVCDKKAGKARSQKSIKLLPEFTQEAATLKAINSRLKPNAASILASEKAIETIVKELYVKINTLSDSLKTTIINESNLRVLNSFWRDKYETRRVVDKERTRNAFEYALRTLEPLSLEGSSQVELQKHMDKKLAGTAHKRYSGCINTLLAYLGRGIALQVAEVEQPDVQFLSIEKFNSVLAGVQDRKLKLLMATLFATGCRTGEAFALTSSSFKSDGVIFISHQIDRKLVRRKTKNGVKHDALIVHDYLNELKEWCALDQDEKNEIRHSCAKDIPKELRRAGKRLTAHNLRHSHVHCLMDNGVPLDRVAQLIGDSLPVVEKHYRGWIVGDGALAGLVDLMKLKPKSPSQT
jgi:integrase